MANANLEAELAALRAENAKLKEAATAKITLKMGKEGTICLYHGGRWPVALYATQWERILPFIKAGHVEAFIKSVEDDKDAPIKVSRK